jgi:hypothetical protein
MESARRMVTSGYLRFLLIALPFLLGVGGARSCQVQCGDVLDIDHGQYRLTGDLECPFNASLAAVTITGERVHFNLNGYTITRDDDSGIFLHQGIAVRGAKAHINGGSIVDINCPGVGSQDCAAIRLFGAPGTKINGMSLHNNVIGIASGNDGTANEARIHGNDITGNLRVGIGLFGAAAGAKITDNDLSDTGGFSFGGQGYVSSSDDVSLIGNVANNCAAAGILLLGNEDFPPAQGNTIRDNETLDNGRAGIVCFGATEATRPRDNLIQSNTSFGNAGPDLNEVVEGADTTDCLNTWKDNDFDDARLDCIE